MEEQVSNIFASMSAIL